MNNYIITIFSITIIPLLLWIFYNLYQHNIKTVNYIDRLHAIHVKTSPINSDMIDIPIIYINMDKAVKRKAFIEEQLKGLTVPIVRIKGVVIKDNTKLEGKVAAIGCYLAHVNAMKELINRGWDRALIIEDDACFRLSNKWPQKLSQLEPGSWLSQGNTAYIIDSQTARDFVNYSADKTIFENGVDTDMTTRYGRNKMNDWETYEYTGGWKSYPYIYPASHLFGTQIQDVSGSQTLSEAKRSVCIIEMLEQLVMAAYYSL